MHDKPMDVPKEDNSLTPEQKLVIEKYQRDFMKKNPKASNRQIRRAIVKHFGLEVTKDKPNTTAEAE